MSKLDVELGKWLFEQRPRLLECAVDKTAESLNALAATMGCLLATVKTRSGEKAYRQSLKALVAKIEIATDDTMIAAMMKKGQYSQSKQ